MMTNTERVRKWRLTHSRKEECRKYYEAHKDDVLARNKAWRAEHHEQYLVARRANRAVRAEQYREYSKAYYEQHKAVENERCRAYKHSHPEVTRANYKNRKARLRGVGGSVPTRLWELLKKMCGYRCVICGKSVPLTQDHIIPITKDGPHHIHNIQPTCLPCNSHKRTKAIDYRPQGVRWAIALYT